MNFVLLTFLLQSFFMPSRPAVENPAVITEVPRQIKKDYDKLWTRFRTGREDASVARDADKLLKKQPNFAPILTLEAYMDFYAGRTSDAKRKLGTVLSRDPGNRIAVSYLAELAFGEQDYSRANELYTQLLALDSSRTDVEPKRQKAILLATENLLRDAARAEQENRSADAESIYREALRIAPNESVLHAQFGELLLRQKKWEEALTHFQSEIDLGGPNDEAQRRVAEALMNLGRTEEARNILNRLRETGGGDSALEAKVKELEDLGRWGVDIDQFRRIESSEALTREQLAAVIIRYFPQVTEFRQTPQIVTDIQNSWARLEIQTTVGVGLIEPLPNHTFQPSETVTRGELASSIAHLSRLVGLFGSSAPAIPPLDLAPGNTLYADIQLVLGYGLLTLDDAGNFRINGNVPGEEAVNIAQKLLKLLREKTG